MSTDPAHDDLVDELRLLSNDDVASYLEGRRMQASEETAPSDGLRGVAEAAAAVLGRDDRPQDAYLALALQELGLLWVTVDEKPRGLDALTVAAALYREKGVEELAADCEFLCGLLLDEFGRHDEAAVLYTQAREVFEAHEEFEKMNDCDVKLGCVLPRVPMACAIRGQFEQLDNEQLSALLEAGCNREPNQNLVLLATQGWETLSDPRRPRDWHWAGCAFGVGTAWYLSGDHAHAAPAFHAAAEVYEECGESDLAGRALRAAAWSLEELGRLPEAIAAYTRARDHHLTAECHDAVIDCSISCGRLSKLMGELEDSVASYRAALDHLESHPPAPAGKVGRVHMELGGLHRALSQPMESLRHYLAACNVVDVIRSRADPEKRQKLLDEIFPEAYLSALGTYVELAARARGDGDAEEADRLLEYGRDLAERSQVPDLSDRLMAMVPPPGADEPPEPSSSPLPKPDFADEIRRLGQRPG